MLLLKLGELEEKASPYEKEKSKLEDQLRELNNSAKYTRDKARILVGFFISAPSDISYVREQAEKYGFSPILIINCDVDIENIKACIKDADASWEIMLHSELAKNDSHDRISAVISYLDSVSKNCCDVFFNRGDHLSADNVSKLKSSGFAGYTMYHDSPTSWQNTDGMVYFDYSHIRSDSMALVSRRLSECYAKRAAMMFVLDMESINTNTISQSSLQFVFDELLRVTTEEYCDFSVVSEVVETHSKIIETIKEQEIKNADEAKNIQGRIDELSAIIAEIYSELDKK